MTNNYFLFEDTEDDFLDDEEGFWQDKDIYKEVTGKDFNKRGVGVVIEYNNKYYVPSIFHYTNDYAIATQSSLFLNAIKEQGLSLTDRPFLVPVDADKQYNHDTFFQKLGDGTMLRGVTVDYYSIKEWKKGQKEDFINKYINFYDEIYKYIENHPELTPEEVGEIAAYIDKMINNGQTNELLAILNKEPEEDMVIDLFGKD